MKVYTAKQINKKTNKEFFTSRIDEKDSYGQFYFITQKGELGLLDCINSKPKAIEEIESIMNQHPLFHELIPFEKISIQHHAWRYFADKSRNGDIWYIENIFGVPEIGGLFTLENIDENIQLETYESDVELQDITYHQWESLSLEEKIKLIDRFIHNPVESTAPILDDYFH